MHRLRYAAILYLAFIALCANAACWQELPTSKPASVADSTQSDGGPVIRTPGAVANSHMSAANLTELNNTICWIGQSLAPGDICTYPGTSDEFRVDSEGKGHFLFFTATAVIKAQNANINGRSYDFSARKQDDGNWVIELAGTSVNVIRVSDLIAPAVDSTSSTASTGPPATQEEILPSASPSGGAGTPASAPRLLYSIAETTSSHGEVSDSESLRHSPVEAPMSDLPSAPESSSSDSAAAVSADATASKSQAPTIRQNRSPQIVGKIGEQTVTIGESIVVNIAPVFSDADGDELERYIAILSNTTIASGTTDLATGSLTLTGLKIGSSWVAIKACDRSDCSAPGDLTFLLTVEPPPNRPPQLVSYIEDQHVTVGKVNSVSVRSAFRDFEGDRIVSYEVKPQDDGLAEVTVNAAKGILRLKGLRAGSTTVLVKACDFQICGSDTSVLRFSLEVVAPPNSSPIVTRSIADQTISIGDMIQLDISPYFDDPERGQIWKYQFSQTEYGVAEGTIDSNTGILNIKGVAAGITSISVNAGAGNRRNEKFNLTFNLEVKEPTS